ncbi:hypothetical protein L7F22_027841 [Adiantum nelumboides]|nr:hypothetical protein [Adiantum nelumboides]
MAFPNFFGKQYESASNFLDDLEMAFLVSGRDEEEVKLRAFPLVLKDSAKNWFQNLEPGRKTNWETVKETFLSKYGGLDNPEHLWHRISSLHQATSRTYLTYESQFLRLWAEWEASLAEGERAPNFLKKEKFLAGLFPDLQEKVKGKFPETFEEALQIARVKDRKLEYQAHTSRVEHPQGPTMADERLPPAPTTTPEDPHLELLQRVTNQLDNLSINMVQGVRQQQPQPNNERMPNGPRRQPQRRDYFCYNCGEEGHGMYFCPHPRNFNAHAGRGRQQVTPPRARPPPQIQPQILQNPQMVAQPQVLQRSVSPQPVAEIPPLPNNNAEKARSSSNTEVALLPKHGALGSPSLNLLLPRCLHTGGGVAQQVDKTTSLARKVFRLLKSVNELEGLLAPAEKSTPLPLVLLARAKSCLLATFFALDQIVWAGRTGIYKNKERTELISKISLYCFLGGSATNSLHELGQLIHLSRMKQQAEDELVGATTAGKSSLSRGCWDGEIFFWILLLALGFSNCTQEGHTKGYWSFWICNIIDILLSAASISKSQGQIRCTHADCRLVVVIIQEPYNVVLLAPGHYCGPYLFTHCSYTAARENLSCRFCLNAFLALRLQRL